MNKTYRVKLKLLVEVDKVIIADTHEDAVRKCKDLVTREGYDVIKHTWANTTVVDEEEIDFILSARKPYFWLGDGS